MEGRKSVTFYLQLLRYNPLNLLSGLKCKSVNRKSCFIIFAVQ